MTPAASFFEFEHKYCVEERFDLRAFDEKLRKLSLLDYIEVDVTDTYYATDKTKSYIFRHRYDQELQHFTVKSLGEDVETRLEVNLDLGHGKGNQAEAVQAFLQPFEIVYSGQLRKSIKAWYYRDCEVVFYRAESGGLTTFCVEFEARNVNDLESAREIILRYEKATGFCNSQREKRSLFHLLLVPQMDSELKRTFLVDV